MYGGNTAIAAMQYSYQPGWISFLTQRPQARQAGRALFNTIYTYWSGLPPSHRPQLVVFGESLGAYGAEAAFSSVADITARTSGALFVGPPNDTEVWRELTNARVSGSPEWLPVYGDGRTVRFAASASKLRLPGRALRHPEIVYLQHASDPSCGGRRASFCISLTGWPNPGELMSRRRCSGIHSSPSGRSPPT